MTQIVDHGKWVLYQPDKLPEHAPPGALFVRRESDGVDWYEYIKDENSFAADTVKFTALWQDIHNGFTISAATRDPARLFPAGQLVREIIDYHGSDDPQVELGEKLYNPDTHRLRDRPELPALDFGFKALEARVAAIEAKLGLGG
jgi:hypothetical protein